MTATNTDERSRTAREERLAKNAGALLSINDIAVEFQVQPRTINRWVTDGNFPRPDVHITRKFRRWRRETVDEARGKLAVQ